MDPEHAACFEAGIKFGSLYHQFAGTPVSPESAASLAAAIEAAIENQPGCRSVTVEMNREAIGEAAGEHGYTELTGRFMEVELVVVHRDVEVVAAMALDSGYPLMELVSVA